MIKSGNPKPILLIASFLLVFGFSFGFSPTQIENASVVEISYTDVVAYGDGFIAITNNGRIDWISYNGDVTKTKSFDGESFKRILINNLQLVILDVHGQILLFENDSSFHKIENQSQTIINCITLFKNRIIAGCDKGELCVENTDNSFKSIQLELKGSIISLSSGINDCWGVTDQGEIIHSNDGINWAIFDFNTLYKGFYKSCSFSKVLLASDQIAVVGRNEDGSPALFFSSKGNVWTERSLLFTDENGVMEMLKDAPNDIFYDHVNDQFILCGSEGQMLTVTSCSHCQRSHKIYNRKLNAIAGNNQKIVLVGESDFRIVFDLNSI